MNEPDTTEVAAPARRRAGRDAPALFPGLLVVWAPQDPAALGAFVPAAPQGVLQRARSCVAAKQPAICMRHMQTH